MSIVTYAHPRFSIAGNPSDGFWGKCVSAGFDNFGARVTLIDDLERRVDILDSTGLLPTNNRLPWATFNSLETFIDINDIKVENPERGFHILYESTIPFAMSFSGSSAISIAILRALTTFFHIQLTDNDIESIALHAETNDLRRSAGPQDSIAVNRGGCCYMDFSKEAYRRTAKGVNLDALTAARIHRDYSSSKAFLLNTPGEKGSYTSEPLIKNLDVGGFTFFLLCPPCSIDSTLETNHYSDRFKYERMPDPRIREGMKKIADLADVAYQAIEDQDIAGLGGAMDRNLDLSFDYLGAYIDPVFKQHALELRQFGAWCKFAGTAGAVIGLVESDRAIEKIKCHYKNLMVQRIHICEPGV